MDQETPEQGATSRWFKRLGVVVGVLAMLGVLAWATGGFSSGPPQRAVSELAAQMKHGQVSSIQLKGDRASVRTVSGEQYTTVLGRADFFQSMAELGVTPDDLSRVASINDTDPSVVDWGNVVRVVALPCMLLLFLFAQQQGPTEEILSFTRSHPRQAALSSRTSRFDEVAGLHEAKEEVRELAEFLRWPWRFAALGGSAPKGVLLNGPPGTGKTLLARAVAGEADVPFLSVNGSEFVEIVAGVAASRIRDLFDVARRSAPCIVFIDELDAIGRCRTGGGSAYTNDEREQALNQLLVEMDGFSSDTRVIVLAATNRADMLDPALVRPGRFDRRIEVAVPDRAERLEILQVHARGKPLDRSVDLPALAAVTGGLTGADLANVMNEAAILAARQTKRAIGMAELHEAVERVLDGPERRSATPNAHDRELTAYRQAGHAVVMRHTPGHDPVYRVSIMPRTHAMGSARSLAREANEGFTRSDLEAQLSAALAGSAAEQLVFGEVSSGCGDDLVRATDIARQIVTAHGMTDTPGWIAGPAGYSSISNRTAEMIDDEIHRLIVEGCAHATDILVARRDELDGVARALLEQATLERDDLEHVLHPRQAARDS